MLRSKLTTITRELKRACLLSSSVPKTRFFYTAQGPVCNPHLQQTNHLRFYSSVADSDHGEKQKDEKGVFGEVCRRHSCTKAPLFDYGISVTFIDKDGEENHIRVPIGMSMLEAAHENDIELEGACEGSLACSTCHVIVMDVDYYNKLEDPVDEENDMLDLAFGLTETSRLGCQVIAKPELDGIRLALPSATRNFAVDGYVPKPH